MASDIGDKKKEITLLRIPILFSRFIIFNKYLKILIIDRMKLIPETNIINTAKPSTPSGISEILVTATNTNPVRAIERPKIPNVILNKSNSK